MLPRRFTWETFIDRKSRSFRATLARMFETITGGVYYPKRVLATILESHSKTTSFRSTSQAKDTHPSMAFASISSGPKG